LFKISTPTAAVTTTNFGTATVGGRGASNSSTANNYSFNAGSVVAETARRPAVSATLGFRPNLPSSVQLQTELRDLIDRSTTIASKQKISIQMDGRNVILRGQVADDEERRLVESLIATTPGVGFVKNELVALSP
jgi:hypothetical protein